MPDSTLSPGNPGVPRDTDRRASEQGAGAPRRTPPGAPAASGLVRSRAPRPGAVGRAERVEPRWRDIQWIDFTSEPDSEETPAPESNRVPAGSTMAEPAPRVAPELSKPLHHLGATAVKPRRATNDAIPGLVSRFVRLPVPRFPAATARNPVETMARRLEPRLAFPVAKIAPLPLWLQKPAPEPGNREPSKHDPAMLSDVAEQPFPAAITTPVSTATLLGGALHSRSVALSMRIGAAGAGLRRVSGTIAAKVTDRLARVRTTAWRRRAPIDPIEPAGPSEQSRPLNSAIAAVSRYVAARENWLRLSGMIALAAAFAGLFAYGGGAMITRMAATSGNTGATSAVSRQPALADKAPQTPRSPAPAPVPPAPTSNIPPNEPAARAAFYLARAKAGDVAAQYDIGVLYARGDGLVQDYVSAASWFHVAAAQGSIASEYNLGVLYERGLGVAADKTEALNWYRSAADRNEPAAQFNLALAYAQGNGTPQDLAAAARWYQRAAEQGVAAAMVNLAILYEKGSGLDRSPTDAYAWYSAAGERGDSGAKARAGALFQQFNDKDKAHAEGLAATIGAALDSPPSPA